VLALVLHFSVSFLLSALAMEPETKTADDSELRWYAEVVPQADGSTITFTHLGGVYREDLLCGETSPKSDQTFQASGESLAAEA
jgi:hypothetical protein